MLANVHRFLVFDWFFCNLVMNKKHVYILPTYVLLPISCVDLCRNIVTC